MKSKNLMKFHEQLIHDIEISTRLDWKPPWGLEIYWKSQNKSKAGSADWAKPVDFVQCVCGAEARAEDGTETISEGMEITWLYTTGTPLNLTTSSTGP